MFGEYAPTYCPSGEARARRGGFFAWMRAHAIMEVPKQPDASNQVAIKLRSQVVLL